MTLEVSTKLLKILFGLYSNSNLLYLSIMKSVFINHKNYNLSDVQRLKQAIGRDKQEVISLRVYIERD